MLLTSAPSGTAAGNRNETIAISLKDEAGELPPENCIWSENITNAGRGA